MGCLWTVFNAVRADKSYVIKMYVSHWDLTIFGSSALLGTALGGLLGCLGGVLARLGALWGVLERSFGVSGPSWAVLETSWGLLGSS
eukprot:5984881-Pyramimonas_sp.AAC.1